MPCKSPLFGIASPDFESLATMTTEPASESFLVGIGLLESSSRKVKGRSCFVARTIATGIGGPSTARAKTKRVSVGDPFPASLGAIVIVPVMAGPVLEEETEAAGRAACMGPPAGVGAAARPSSPRTSLMLEANSRINSGSVSGGSPCCAASQCLSAVGNSFRS